MKDLKISKELLSEVLKLEVVKHSLYNELHKSFNITYMQSEDSLKSSWMPINVYEFTFMCKKWAYSKLMIANSGSQSYNMGINNANRKAKLIIGKLIKEIEEFDSLDNRNCSNCKHTDDGYFDLFCINPDVINQHNHLFENGQSMYDTFKVSANFSCNKWELGK